MRRGGALVVLWTAACATTDAGEDRARAEAELARRAQLGEIADGTLADGTGDGALPQAALALLEDGLDEEDAVRVALLANREVQAALAGLGVARAELAQAALPANPILSADATFHGGATEVELALVQPLLDLLLIPLRKRIAGAQREAAEAAVERTLVHLVFDVRRAFVRLRAAEEAVGLAHAEVIVAEAARELMVRLHDAGNVTDPERTAEEAELAHARLERSLAESERLEAREEMNVLLGLFGSATAWKPAGAPRAAPEPADFARLESRAIAASLDLAESRGRSESLAQLAGVRDWTRVLGDVEVGVAARRDPDEGWGLGPAGSIALPLFDGGSASRAAAQARLRQALAGHAALAVEVRSAARVLRERSRAGLDRARHAREVLVPLHSRLVEETLRNYNAMQIGTFAVFAARREELRAQREAVALEREARLARLDLDELLAGSLARERVAMRPAAAAIPRAEPRSIRRIEAGH